jgi:F-type H+-transporting ATPase subunit alpha
MTPAASHPTLGSALNDTLETIRRVRHNFTLSPSMRKELGGGSLTALPIVETEEQNISAYIPTNLISITDGQIYLSPSLFQKGILPAVDVGMSVSRVGGKAQLPAYRAVAGDLRLFYSQFEELEVFSRFGSRLDEHTRTTLARGRAIREALKQPQLDPLPASVQVATLVAATAGLFDNLSPDQVAAASAQIRIWATQKLPRLMESIETGHALSDSDRAALVSLAEEAIACKPPSH